MEDETLEQRSAKLLTCHTGKAMANVVGSAGLIRQRPTECLPGSRNEPKKIQPDRRLDGHIWDVRT